RRARRPPPLAGRGRAPTGAGSFRSGFRARPVRIVPYPRGDRQRNGRTGSVLTLPGPVVSPSSSAALPPLVVLVGPTASGKSALALRVAEATGGEIVSADSVQVYRGFDIGSGKSTPDERARVPHHLIDVAAPDAPIDAAEWA